MNSETIKLIPQKLNKIKSFATKYFNTQVIANSKT